MNSDSSQLSSLLTETIRMLCQSGVQYSENLRIQGLLVVTADTNRVQVIEISDTFPSPQDGVGSSELGETETDMDYKPHVHAGTPDFPVHSPVTQQRMGSSFQAGMHRGNHAVRPPVKRRGFPIYSNRGHQRITPKKPRVKMEDPIILVDSPDEAPSDVIEPKVETGWVDAASGYQNILEYPEAGDMPGSHGTAMQLHSNSHSFHPPSGRHRGQHRDAVTHTVTASDGANEQVAQDIKPYQLNYPEEEQYDEDGNQSFLPAVGKILCEFLYVAVWRIILCCTQGGSK